MKHSNRIFLCVVIALFGAIFFVPEVKAEGQSATSKVSYRARQNKYNSIRWGKKAHKSNGLYAIRNRQIGNGVCLDVNAMYYYGDVDQLDQAFVHGFQPQNLSVGAGLHFSYLMPQGQFFNWKFSLGLGYLHGDDSNRPDGNYKGNFKSVFGELAAGLEFYPIQHAGFYIYAGLGVNISGITYDFSHYSWAGSGHTTSAVPMLPIEIGYNFYLGRSFFLGISLGVHQALLDMGHSNLDAWPLETTSQKFQWGDGYFMLGISFSYRWHNCETCRMAR